MANDPLPINSTPSAVASAGYKDAWLRLALALNELAAHLVATIAVLLSINLVELLIKYLAHGDLVFFRGSGVFEFHAQWLFDAADLGLLIVLAVRIVYAFYKIFRG